VPLGPFQNSRVESLSRGVDFRRAHSIRGEKLVLEKKVALVTFCLLETRNGLREMSENRRFGGIAKAKGRSTLSRPKKKVGQRKDGIKGKAYWGGGGGGGGGGRGGAVG